MLPPAPRRAAVFTRSVVLNITRKNREWRFYEFVGLRIEDLPKAGAVVSDIRKILRQVRVRGCAGGGEGGSGVGVAWLHQRRELGELLPSDRR